LVTTGTVASTVQVALTDLVAAGAPMAQFPAPKVFRIPAQAPAITSACYARTLAGADFRINGISTTRELTFARIVIPTLQKLPTTPIPPVPPEFVINPGGDIKVDLSGLALGYFSSPLSVRTGGTFSLAIPVPFDLAIDLDLGSVTVDLANDAGSSGARPVQLCQ
jgi:hypothetical protein